MRWNFETQNKLQVIEPIQGENGECNEINKLHDYIKQLTYENSVK